LAFTIHFRPFSNYEKFYKHGFAPLSSDLSVSSTKKKILSSILFINYKILKSDAFLVLVFVESPSTIIFKYPFLNKLYQFGNNICTHGLIKLIFINNEFRGKL